MMNETIETGASMAATAVQPVSPYANTNLELVLGMVIFAAAGFAIVFFGLLIGRLLRPALPHPEKAAAYECGEPAIGESWVQFDLRFYTVALVFIVFDVEIALLWPWAVVFREMGAPAFWAFLVFFLLIAIPFLYEWKSGYLDWVRASTAQQRPRVLQEPVTGSAAVSSGEPTATRWRGMERPAPGRPVQA